MGMTWADLLGLYMQYRAADKASDQKPQYSISPQMDELFKRMMGLVDYSPTRDYISSYADSYIKSTNAPGGMASWKPTFQSDYMKNQPPLPNTGLDLSKLPIFQGDANGKMPWNHGYTGPGIGGQPAKPPGTPGDRGGLPPSNSGFGPPMPSFFDPAYTNRGAGVAWGPRNNTTGDGDNPGSQGGFGMTHQALPDSFIDKWIDNSGGTMAVIKEAGRWVLMLGGVVLGYAVGGAPGAGAVWKLTPDGWKHWNTTHPPSGAAGAGSGAGNAGGNG